MLNKEESLMAFNARTNKETLVARYKGYCAVYNVAELNHNYSAQDILDYRYKEVVYKMTAELLTNVELAQYKLYDRLMTYAAINEYKMIGRYDHCIVFAGVVYLNPTETSDGTYRLTDNFGVYVCDHGKVAKQLAISQADFKVVCPIPCYLSKPDTTITIHYTPDEHVKYIKKRLGPKYKNVIVIADDVKFFNLECAEDTILITGVDDCNGYADLRPEFGIYRIDADHKPELMTKDRYLVQRAWGWNCYITLE